MRQNAKPPPFPFLPSLSGSFSFQPSAMFPPQFTHSVLLVPLQKISELHNFKTVKASPHQGAKIPLVQGQKRIGKRKRREKNRPVFCWRKDNWPIHHILVSHQPQIGFQPTPVGHGLLSQRPNVGPHLAHHISTGQKRPPLMFANIENPPRRSRITPTSNQDHTGVEKHPHWSRVISRKSASSSSIHAFISSEEKILGTMSGGPSTRNFPSRKPKSSRCWSEGNISAAFSISKRVLIDRSNKFHPYCLSRFRHATLHPVSSSSNILTQNERKCCLTPSFRSHQDTEKSPRPERLGPRRHQHLIALTLLKLRQSQCIRMRGEFLRLLDSNACLAELKVYARRAGIG